jgi:hypothetical protein
VGHRSALVGWFALAGVVREVRVVVVVC